MQITFVNRNINRTAYVRVSHCYDENYKMILTSIFSIIIFSKMLSFVTLLPVRAYLTLETLLQTTAGRTLFD